MGIRCTDASLATELQDLLQDDALRVLDDVDARATADFSVLREEQAMGRPLTVVYRQGTAIGRFRTAADAAASLRGELLDVPISRASDVVALELVRLQSAVGVVLLPGWLAQLRSTMERRLLAQGWRWMPGRFARFDLSGESLDGDGGPLLGLLVYGSDRDPEVTLDHDGVLGTLWMACGNREAVGAHAAIPVLDRIARTLPARWLAGQDLTAVDAALRSLR